MPLDVRQHQQDWPTGWQRTTRTGDCIVNDLTDEHLLNSWRLRPATNRVHTRGITHRTGDRQHPKIGRPVRVLAKAHAGWSQAARVRSACCVIVHDSPRAISGLEVTDEHT